MRTIQVNGMSINNQLLRSAGFRHPRSNQLAGNLPEAAIFRHFRETVFPQKCRFNSLFHAATW